MPKKKKFYVKAAKMVFKVPVLVKDEKGEMAKIPLRDSLGNIRIANGEPVYVGKYIEFQNLTNNPAMGTLCVYETSDDIEIAALEKLNVDSPGPAKVMTEAQWKKDKNPLAYEQELKAQRLEQDRLDLLSRNTELEKRLESLEKGAPPDHKVAPASEKKVK